ncbi:hypothetical protein NDA18_004642 [Ustilago nuda]|nr:hypothetical protein NDA18_004642 [Ustilago nuda]
MEERIKVSENMDTYSHRECLGITTAIVPFNFSTMILLWSFPMATITSTTLILKPSERVPGISMIIVERCESAGKPKGVLNLVNSTADVVNDICDNPRKQGVSSASLSNAYTGMDNTNFSSYVSPDRFAQSLLGSLFDPPCSERETKAVDSEHKKKPQSGMWHSFHLGKTTISTTKDYTDTQDELASGRITLKVLSGSAVTIAKETHNMLWHRAHLTGMAGDDVNDAPTPEKDGKQYIAAKDAPNAILKQLVGAICKSAGVEGKIANDEAKGFIKHAECLKLIHKQHPIPIAVGRVSHPTMKPFVKLLDDHDGQQDSHVIDTLEIIGEEHVIIQISCWLVILIPDVTAPDTALMLTCAIDDEDQELPDCRVNLSSRVAHSITITEMKSCIHQESAPQHNSEAPKVQLKIKVANPVAELDSDEMACIIWHKFCQDLTFLFIDIDLRYHDCSMEHRDATDDKVTVVAAEAIVSGCTPKT